MSIATLAFLAPALVSCDLACTENENTQGGTCVAKSLARFQGEPQERTIAWSPGQKLQVSGVHGDIVVSKGVNAKEIRVTFEPFSYRAHDSKQAADREMEENLVLIAGSGDSVSISADREGGSDALGTHIRVELPPEFDGELAVLNAGASSINPGNIEIEFVGSSGAVRVKNVGIGACLLTGAPSVMDTQVNCGGRSEVLDVSDDVDIQTTGLSTDTAIFLRLAAVSSSAKGGQVISRDGHVEVRLPTQGNYSVSASSPTLGGVELGAPPAGCSASAAEPWTLSCGSAGASYTIVAGDNGLGKSDVTLAYE